MATKKTQKTQKSEPATPHITLVNQVLTGDLGKKLKLESISSKLASTEYNPDQFPGLVLRIKNPKASMLLFSSGKLVCAGTKSMEDANKAVNTAIKSLNKLGYKIAANPELKVQNMVFYGNLGFTLNLNNLVMKLDNTEYEPEQFPGLVYKITDPVASFLIFSNGKIVVAGTKSRETVEKAVEKLLATLKKVM